MRDKVQLLNLNVQNFNTVFKANLLSLSEVIDKNNLLNIRMKYGIIYNYDSVKFGEIVDLDLDINNIIEARFFDENSEVLVRIEDDLIFGNILKDNGEDKENYSIDEFILYENKTNNVKKKYKKIHVKKYIDYDEDEQAYYYYMKPCRLERV